jgi:glucose/arabinose dehydrogenase
MLTTAHPSVTDVTPKNGATNVARNIFIACDVHLVGSGLGVDPRFLKGNVTLTQTSNNKSVAGDVNTSGGGDTIVFTPSAILASNTKYTFKVTTSVKDDGGNSFNAFTSTFTTGTAGGTVNSKIAFDKVSLPSPTGHNFTAVVVGPDHRLYVGDQGGDIFRYDINANGTLTNMLSIQTLKSHNGGSRTLIGMAFDPASTKTNPILWVSNGVPSNNATGAADWTGKISKLSGANLQNYQDEVTGLPRSFQDHQTEQMSFGPDGALYISQGSMTAMGAPDAAWGNRTEHLLSAAILRLDTKKLGTTPLNVKTKEGGGTYNPFAATAPLTIYADGVRNSYDLVWTHDGFLFSSTNGSAKGGNTPAGKAPFSGTRIDQATKGPYTGPAVPALTNVPAQSDYLYNIVKGGYYGHPNPLRGEYVENGGNPTAGVDKGEVAQYPVGTKPDRNYRGFAWDLGKFESPDGAIEYKGNAFGGALNGSLMIAQYSGGDNIVVLSRSGSKITGAVENYTGLTGYNDPLDLAEDLTTGNIYVAEWGGQRITLLRPHVTTPAPAVAKATAAQSVFSTKPTGDSLASQVL